MQSYCIGLQKYDFFIYRLQKLINNPAYIALKARPRHGMRAQKYVSNPILKGSP